MIKSNSARPVKSMSEVARLAGVSLMTVHRAFHEHRDIREETRRRILDLAAAHGYRPNGAARAIREGRFNSIGLAIGPADIEMAALIGISRVLNRSDRNLIIAEIPYESELRLSQPIPRMFREHMVDGLIRHAKLFDYGDELSWLQKMSSPEIVIMGESDVNNIRPDYPGAMAEVLERLGGMGYGHFIYAGALHAPSFHHAYDLANFFRNRRDAGLDCELVSFDSDMPREDRGKNVSELVKSSKKRIAIITSDPENARFCYALLRGIGMNVPEDIGLLTVATRDEYTDAGVQISSYRYSSYDFGEEVAKMVIDRIASGGKDIPSRGLALRYVAGETI